VAHQPHDVPAGVQIEGSGLAQGLHIDLVREMIAFGAIASVAAGHQVLPGGGASSRARDDVIERKLGGAQRGTAILAGVPVAQQNILAREGAGLVGDTAVFEQPDHRRHANGNARRVQKMSVLFFGHGYAFEHQHNGAARGAHIDGLIGSIQHEHRRMHHGAAWLAGNVRF